MARKQETLWEVSKSREVSADDLFSAYTEITLYALRSDGVLLTCLKTTRADGSTRNYGWKIATRHPVEGVKAVLERQGYR